MSQVTDAVATMSGEALVEWLATFDYGKPAVRETRPPYGTPHYGRHYNETGDAGVGDARPDTWDEVEYLKNAGVLDRETYYAALERRQGAAAK